MYGLRRVALYLRCLEIPKILSFSIQYNLGKTAFLELVSKTAIMSRVRTIHVLQSVGAVGKGAISSKASTKTFLQD